MKNILISNTAWKELHRLKRTLNLRNTNQVVELLLERYRKEEQHKFNQHIKDLFGV